MDEPILLQIGTIGPRHKGMKRSSLRSGDQRSRSRSQEAEVRSLVLVEASFSTLLGRVGFLVFLCTCQLSTVHSDSPGVSSMFSFDGGLHCVSAFQLYCYVCGLLIALSL